jgi:hypothetical protein
MDKSSIRKANEAAAVATLQTIKLAETKYVADHKGEYGTFRQLFAEGYRQAIRCRQTAAPRLRIQDHVDAENRRESSRF